MFFRHRHIFLYCSLCHWNASHLDLLNLSPHCRIVWREPRFHPPHPRGPFPLAIFTEKSLCAENTKCLSWAIKIGPSVAVSHVNAVRKNHPATNPLLFSMLNNGWRKPMNPWANGLYSHLSAHILLTHRPFPLSSAAHILTVLCACACLSLYSH